MTTTAMTLAMTSVRGWRRSDREEGDGTREQKSQHVSVMTEEALDLLNVKDGELVVDATAGMGGHSEAILKAAKTKLIALDADPAAAEASRERLARFKSRAAVLEANFADMEKALKEVGVTSVDKVLFDLGWNRTQLEAGRGFSFMRDEPLDMSYGPEPRSGFTAAQALNTWSETALADAIFGYGEERYARRIAKAIVRRRQTQPISSTIELVEIIGDAVPAAYRRGRPGRSGIHFATRTFQALRIAVNDELGAVEAGVRAAWRLLSENGRIAVITFHSVEDRAVKRLFASLAKEDGRLLVKKPLTASAAEIKRNPPSRSAKLRAIEKVCQK